MQIIFISKNDDPDKNQRWKFVREKTLDPFIDKIRCRFVYDGPDKLRHTPTEKSNYPLCDLHKCKCGRKNQRY